MVYETPLEVMMALYHKLKKSQDTKMKSIQEITLQLRFLEDKPAVDVLRNKLVAKLDKLHDELAEIEIQLDSIDKGRNGGATLDNFLTDDNLDIVKNQMNIN